MTPRRHFRARAPSTRRAFTQPGTLTDLCYPCRTVTRTLSIIRQDCRPPVTSSVKRDSNGMWRLLDGQIP
ncbi:hypothetical protein EVAR_34518_1 [Eumeta japonica]|uniref:Uncharacterized protein n=1 Tax=Eumeta variegata TaxID=151549 RepID=A0A4C1Z6Z7_EUMVA|nr:hypothetical protein EVAR_34518_1 [Eumeta japonica]